ncbi:MAG: helix-turn-helix transcriptional regulator [Anaerolineae bacterium]|nr:helix-turn-helix transcriptional regulator [Anaerolineae bacterium]
MGYISCREVDVFRLLAGGFTVNEIASALGIAPRTVYLYMWRVRSKLCVSNAYSALFLLTAHGYLTLDGVRFSRK